MTAVALDTPDANTYTITYADRSALTFTYREDRGAWQVTTTAPGQDPATTPLYVSSQSLDRLIDRAADEIVAAAPNLP